MSRLHDLKTGSTKFVAKHVGKALGKHLGMPNQIDLDEICKNEDPAKVRAFLEDVANEPTLPMSVRSSCKQLLKQFDDGAPLGQAIAEQNRKNIQQLETKLREGNAR